MVDFDLLSNLFNCNIKEKNFLNVDLIRLQYNTVLVHQSKTRKLPPLTLI